MMCNRSKKDDIEAPVVDLVRFSWDDEVRDGIEATQDPELLRAIAKKLGLYYHHDDFIGEVNASQSHTKVLVTGVIYLYVSHHLF